jgi:DNA-directed RNA polymerase subunit RPC12/RpoP
MLKWSGQNQDEENQALFRCGECDETFSKPILATVFSHGQAQTYYACPRCLTKVAEQKRSSKSEKETSPLIEKVKKATATEEDNVKCTHFLGYLKKRPKNTPIPDECLTCGKMVECLIH